MQFGAAACTALLLSKHRGVLTERSCLVGTPRLMTSAKMMARFRRTSAQGVPLRGTEFAVTIDVRRSAVIYAACCNVMTSS